MKASPVQNLEKAVIEETKNAAASHGFSHLIRVAKGAEWFCRLLGGSQHGMQIAYAAGLLHDIVRPATEKYDPLEDAMKKARLMLQNLKFEKKMTEELIDAIYAHHHPDPKKVAGYSVFLADKILEGMGAYIVFRRAIFMGESPDFAGMDRAEATISHWTARINRWLPPKFERKFARLVDYQFSWCSRFLEAFRNGRRWALHLNDAGFEAGTKCISTDAFLSLFEPRSGEEKRFKEEALSYIRWKKFPVFAGMVKGAR